MRIKFSEITLKRIYEAIERRIFALQDNIYWNLKPNRENIDRIKSFYNKHEGQKCVLIANGPSLNKIDWKLLEDENLIGMNRIYLLQKEIQFDLKYYIVINELVIDQFYDEIDQLNVPKFINFNRRKLFRKEDNVFIRSKIKFRSKFSKNLAYCSYGGGTVTYNALQLCFYLGFSKVILIGLDHNYHEKGVPNKTEIKKESEDLSHFSPNYFSKGIKWQLPDLLQSEYNYETAKVFFEKNNREIIDATIDGKCKIFKKMGLKEALEL